MRQQKRTEWFATADVLVYIVRGWHREVTEEEWANRNESVHMRRGRFLVFRKTFSPFNRKQANVARYVKRQSSQSQWDMIWGIEKASENGTKTFSSDGPTSTPQNLTDKEEAVFLEILKWFFSRNGPFGNYLLPTRLRVSSHFCKLKGKLSWKTATKLFEHKWFYLGFSSLHKSNLIIC